jgi:peroxiredoxin
MTRGRQWMMVGAVVVALVVAGVIGARSLDGAVEPGARAPEFSAKPVSLTDTLTPTAQLADVHLADYKGKVVFLNIWATWCDPCRREMPSIQLLHDALGKEGLQVLAVSIDRAGMEQPIREFAREYKLDFPILYDPSGTIQTTYQTGGVPETFIIGRDGTLRKRVLSAVDWNAEQQRTLIRTLLSEPAP